MYKYSHPVHEDFCMLHNEVQFLCANKIFQNNNIVYTMCHTHVSYLIVTCTAYSSINNSVHSKFMT